MDRATFEKIVGGYNTAINENELFVRLSKGYVDLKQHDDLLVVGNDLTQFRLRCLLHGLGIKCDWDAEVTFERLMELEGAVAVVNDDVYKHVKIGEFEFACGECVGLGWWAEPDSVISFKVTTMRQVHLLLEAAGVGG